MIIFSIGLQDRRTTHGCRQPHIEFQVFGETDRMSSSVPRLSDECLTMSAGMDTLLSRSSCRRTRISCVWDTKFEINEVKNCLAFHAIARTSQTFVKKKAALTLLRLYRIFVVGSVSLSVPATSIPVATIVDIICGLTCGFVIYQFGSRTSEYSGPFSSDD